MISWCWTMIRLSLWWSARASSYLKCLSVSSIRVGDVDIIPVYSANNLGSWFDSLMDMATHITKTCSAFFYLYNIRHMWKYLTSQCTEKLIRAIITSRLDYCNSLLYGVADHHIIVMITCKNSNVSWMPVRDWSSAHLTAVILPRSFNSFTGCLSAYVSSLKSFWLPLKHSRAHFLNISLILPPSRYDSRSRRNNKGILLSTLKRFTKVTMEDRSFMAEARRLWNSLLVSTRSLYSFLQMTFLVANCK